MNGIDNFFQDLYKNFNDRNIDLVIFQMTGHVKWAKGMEGGYIYGHDDVNEYWTRQFTMVSATVTPVQFDIGDNIVKIKVHQVFMT